MASAPSVETIRLSWLRALPGLGGGTKLPWLPLSVMVVLLACSIFAPLLAPQTLLESTYLRPS